jgi:FtsZ-binding cell division protein ZapB
MLGGLKMLVLLRELVISFALFMIPALVLADSATDIQALKDAKAVLDAKSAKDTAEATALNQADTATALTKSKVAAQAAQADALKASFGAPPIVGGDGNITISDVSSGMLLEVKAGSLKATLVLAENLCTVLKAAQVSNAFIAPNDLDTKIQSARMVLREFNALYEKVSSQQNRILVGLEGAEAHVGPATVLGAVSLVQYGAGALQTIAKLFKSDYTIGLASDSTRAAWLEYFMGTKCPDVIPIVQLESVVRNQSIEASLAKLDTMLEFYNAATSIKSATQKKIDLLKEKITSLKAEKKDTKLLEDQLNKTIGQMTSLGALDVWLPRIQALITSVSSAPGPFLDALTWNTFGDEENSLKINTKPRLSVVLTTQDAQVTKSFWLTGKDVYGRSAGELMYRVVKSDGSVVAAGYLTTTSGTGKVDLTAK